MILLRRILLVVTFVAVLVLGWRFAHHNAAPVTVGYVTGELEGVALWVVILASAGLGAGVVGVFAAFSRARTSLLARRYRKTVAGLEAEVHQLRNLPLHPDAPDVAEELAEPSAGGSA